MSIFSSTGVSVATEMIRIARKNPIQEDDGLRCAYLVEHLVMYFVLHQLLFGL